MRSHHPLSNPLLGAALVLLAALAACDGASPYRTPTQPEPPKLPDPPPPPPPITDLSGRWAGTMTITWDEMDGGGDCESPVRAVFVQTGATVTATVREEPGCDPVASEYGLEGWLEGEHLLGRWLHAPWGVQGRVLDDDHLTIRAFNVLWELRRRR